LNYLQLTIDIVLITELYNNFVFRVILRAVVDIKEQLEKPIKGDRSLNKLDGAQDQRARILADSTFSA
jgi:hypothetical protein